MSSTVFWVWRSRYVEGYCVVHPPTKVGKIYQLSMGVSRGDGWPVGIVCRMNDEFPKDIQPPDVLFGPGLVIVSPKVQRVLQALDVADVEFLPVGIVDHKGRPVAGNFVIVNPLGSVECVDIDASGVRWNSINPEKISSCQRLVIDASRVPPERLVFRPKHAEHIVVISDVAARALTAVSPIGLALLDTNEFTGS